MRIESLTEPCWELTIPSSGEPFEVGDAIAHFPSRAAAETEAAHWPDQALTPTRRLRPCVLYACDCGGSELASGLFSDAPGDTTHYSNRAEAIEAAIDGGWHAYRGIIYCPLCVGGLRTAVVADLRAADLERARATYGHLEGWAVWLGSTRDPLSRRRGVLEIPTEQPGYLWLHRGGDKDRCVHIDDVASIEPDHR